MNARAKFQPGIDAGMTAQGLDLEKWKNFMGATGSPRSERELGVFPLRDNEFCSLFALLHNRGKLACKCPKNVSARGDAIRFFPIRLGKRWPPPSYVFC